MLRLVAEHRQQRSADPDESPSVDPTYSKPEGVANSLPLALRAKEHYADRQAATRSKRLRILLSVFEPRSTVGFDGA